MKLVKDFEWEGRAEFRQAENVELKWRRTTASSTGARRTTGRCRSRTGTLKRRGDGVKLEGALDGAYRVRFNEDTLEFRIEPAGAGGAELPDVDRRQRQPGAGPPGFRPRAAR